MPPTLPTLMTNMKDTAFERYSISLSVEFVDPPTPGVSTKIVLPFHLHAWVIFIKGKKSITQGH